MNFQEYYFSDENKKMFMNSIENDLNILLSEEKDYITTNISTDFIKRLLNYLETKCFVSYGDFDTAVGNEIRKYMCSDNKYVKKVKQRIHEIITKARNRFLRDINVKVEKIKVQPRSKPKSSPLHYDPLLSDEPTVGDTPTANI